MTTGTIEIDSRVSHNLGCGPCKSGHYYYRTWNGSNRSGNPDTWVTEQHPYTLVVIDSLYTQGTYKDSSGFTYTGNLQCCQGGVSNPNMWTSNDDIALLGKLRERVAGSSFNAGVAIAESPKSVDLIFDSARRIASALSNTRRGRILEAYRALTGLDRTGKVDARWGQSDRIRNRNYPRFNDKNFSKENVASNWLQLQYGWLPLLQDAHEGAEFLAHQTQPQMYKVRVRRQIVSPVKGATWYTMWKGQTVRKGQIVAYLKEIDVPALAGLKDPLSIAWELVPYSFVIDWFIPIGNYLSARGLAQSLTGTFVTTRFDKCHATFVGMDPKVKLSFDGSGSYKEVRLTRTVSTSLSIPKPEIKPLNQVISWKRAANAVALLINAKR